MNRSTMGPALPTKVHKNYLIGALKSAKLSEVADVMARCVPGWKWGVIALIRALESDPAEWLDEVRLRPPGAA